MATDPLTLFSSSSVLPFGLLLLLCREGENESARLAILRPGPQVAMDSSDIIRVRTSHGTAPPAPNHSAHFQSMSPPHSECSKSSVWLPRNNPRGPSFPEGEWMASCRAASVTSSDFSWKLIWSLQQLFRSVGAEKPKLAQLPHTGHFDVMHEKL